MFNCFIRLFRRERGHDEHTSVRDLASDYIDGETDDETTARVEDHLERCGLCQSFFNTLKATIGLLRSSDRHEPPDSLPDRIREQVRREGAE